MLSDRGEGRRLKLFCMNEHKCTIWTEELLNFGMTMMFMKLALKTCTMTANAVQMIQFTVSTCENAPLSCSYKQRSQAAKAQSPVKKLFFFSF